MKKLGIVLTLMISLIIGINYVDAQEIGGDASTGSGSWGGVNTAYGNVWHGGEGLRVYIVRTSDRVISSNVVDFTNYGLTDSTLSTYRNNGKQTKFDYLYRSVGSINLATLQGGYTYQTPVKPLPSFIQSNDPQVIYNYFMKMTISQRDKLLQVLGFSGSIESIKNKEYYIAAEPVAYFTYGNVNYALSATEVALALTRDQANGSNIAINGCNTAAGGFSCSILNLTHSNLPLSIYIKDSYPSLMLNGETGISASGSKYFNSEEIIGTNGYGIGLFWLIATQPDDSYNGCKPNISNPTCGSQDYGSYSDNSSWKCDYDSIIQNSYCSVYCTEDVDTLFPGNYLTGVSAGSHFVWQTFSVSGRKTCRTRSTNSSDINLTKWNSDWNDVNLKIQQYFKNWRIAVEKNEALDNATTYKNSTSCPLRYNEGGIAGCTQAITKSVTVKTGWDYLYVNGRKVCKGPLTPKRPGSDDYICKAGYVTVDITEQRYYNECLPGATANYNDWYYDKIVPSKSSITVMGETIYLGSYWCSNEVGPSQEDALAAKQYYDSAVTERDNIVKQLNACYNWSSSVSYNLNPSLTINFEYLGMTYNIGLQSNVTNETKSTTYYTGTKAYSTVQKKTVTGAQCNTANNNCTQTYKVAVPTNTMTKVIMDKDLTYTYPTETFRYVLKPSDESVSTLPSSGNYIDIGYGNLPVHPTATQGYHNISLSYSGIGEDGHFDSDIISAGGGTYKCKYYVRKDLIDDPENPGQTCNPDTQTCPNGSDGTKNLYNVIYRTIDLQNPFPSVDGDGRSPGNNWYGSNGSDLVTKYITNNRGINGAQIYLNKEPMYEIELNSVRINAIREYNKTTDYDDFNLTCQTGTGKECKSSFIRDTFKDYFTTGVNGTSTSTCGLSSNWNACDSADGITR